MCLRYNYRLFLTKNVVEILKRDTNVIAKLCEVGQVAFPCRSDFKPFPNSFLPVKNRNTAIPTCLQNPLGEPIFHIVSK